MTNDETIIPTELQEDFSVLREKLDAMESAAERRHEALLQKFEELRVGWLLASDGRGG